MVVQLFYIVFSLLLVGVADGQDMTEEQALNDRAIARDGTERANAIENAKGHSKDSRILLEADASQLAESLLVILLRLEDISATFQGNANLQAQYDFLREHIAYVSTLIKRAGSDRRYMASARVGVDLAGLAYDLMRADRQAAPRGIAGVVRSGSNRGLAWAWEGMRELKGDALWPLHKPKDAQRVLLNSEASRDNVLNAAPIGNVMRTAVTAASIVSTGISINKLLVEDIPALARVASWMSDKGAGVAFLQLSTTGAGPAFIAVAQANKLTLTAAEVSAIAESGRLSATALNLYMMASGTTGGAGSTSGPNFSVRGTGTNRISSAEIGGRKFEWNRGHAYREHVSGPKSNPSRVGTAEEIEESIANDILSRLKAGQNFAAKPPPISSPGTTINIKGVMIRYNAVELQGGVIRVSDYLAL